MGAKVISRVDAFRLLAVIFYFLASCYFFGRGGILYIPAVILLVSSIVYGWLFLTRYE